MSNREPLKVFVESRQFSIAITALIFLLIALIVNSMQSLQGETREALHAEAVVAHDEQEVLLQRVATLTKEFRDLREALRRD